MNEEKVSALVRTLEAKATYCRLHGLSVSTTRYAAGAYDDSAQIARARDAQLWALVKRWRENGCNTIAPQLEAILNGHTDELFPYPTPALPGERRREEKEATPARGGEGSEP